VAPQLFDFLEQRTVRALAAPGAWNRDKPFAVPVLRLYLPSALLV